LTQVERKAHHPTETYATIGVLEESSDGSQRVRPSLVRRTRFDRLTGEVLAGQPDDVGDNGVWDTRCGDDTSLGRHDDLGGVKVSSSVVHSDGIHSLSQG
jgi:hypothetical protein